MKLAHFLLVTSLVLKFNLGTTSGPVFQRFLDDIKPPFSQTLGKLQTLVQVTISESSKYGEDSPINDDYFNNPAIQNAIQATHVTLTQVLGVSQKHVKDYEQLISQQTIGVGNLEAKIADHRRQIATLSQTKTSIQNTAASLQGSIDHTQRLLADAQRQLNSQRRTLRERKERQKILRWVSIFVPPVAIALIITDQELRDTQNNVNKLQRNVQSHEQSKNQAESSLRELNAKIATNENAARTASAQLKESEAALDSLKRERFLILQFEEKLKTSSVFLQKFHGKVEVLYENNRATMLFDSIIVSLKDLLIFLNQNLDSQLTVLATAQDLENIRKLINMKKSLAHP